MALPPIYRIHPAIGIGRVGNADRNTFFIGPELPGRGPIGDATVGTRVPNFKDGGNIKPQAARFRIWEYVEKKGKYEASREINLDQKDCVELKWTVHLANRKASFFKFVRLTGEERAHPAGNRRNDAVVNRRTLEMDPLPRSIKGRNQAPVKFDKGSSSNPANELWPNPAPSPAIEYLGELRTDPAGRLIVLGGRGVASGRSGATLTDAFNNDGWFDDVSDGPVTASLTMKVGGKNKVVKVEPAWFMCGPPDFAPSIKHVVTLYDVLYDMAARELTLPTNEAIYDTTLKGLADINKEFKAAGSAKLSRYKPSFDEEIFPIIRHGQEQIFVFEALKFVHGSLAKFAKLGDPSAAAAPDRQALFNRLHPPGLAGPGGAKNMPLLNGDEYTDPTHKRHALTLTETQFALMEQWVNGNFTAMSGPIPPPLPAAVITPHGLDQAALENCIGGAFCPGIEVSWQIRNKKLFSAPFRIDHSAVTQYLGDTSGQIRAGHFSRQMAVPWHTDFLACKLQNGMGWWPAARPDIVYESKADFDNSPKKSKAWTRPSGANWPSGGQSPTRQEFVDNAHKLGILRQNPQFYHVEGERNSSIP
ncbi:MAG TPA: LodA/GoxA family CTQ-dependent oxidase [Pyrinomonadaceae bacterium]|nr:LodA/GoxA family CTQ-dependent oxidase [Pyrinomonadaceae bacterium]